LSVGWFKGGRGEFFTALFALKSLN